MFNYFNPIEKQSHFEAQKANAIKWTMITLVFLLVVLEVQAISTDDFSSSDYFLFVGQALVISVLFILRNKGTRLAGNVFCIGSVVIMTIVINTFDNDSIFT